MPAVPHSIFHCLLCQWMTLQNEEKQSGNEKKQNSSDMPPPAGKVVNYNSCVGHSVMSDCDPMNCKTPGVTGKAGLGVQHEAGQRLTECCEENALVTANTLFQQHKRRLYTWTSPDGRHQNQIDYILCSQRWRSSIQSAKTILRADCGSAHELLIAKYRLKLKKVEKTTRPFRYDLNQIPYDYTVEVRNRFKGLDLIDRVPDELWMEVCDIVQETGMKTIPKKKKCKRAK